MAELAEERARQITSAKVRTLVGNDLAGAFRGDRAEGQNI